MNRPLSLGEQRLLLFSVFVVSLCGITYELVLGSLATYLLGNPVQQYSITIGVFLSSMGLGSYLSRFITRDLIKNFIRIEIFLGLAGGVSVLVLSYFFATNYSYHILNLFFLLLIGVLVGLEIPLLTRILRGSGNLKEVLSNVLSLDYLGGLAGSLLFPLLLFPFIGRFLTSLIIGVLNVLVGLLLILALKYSKKSIADYLLSLISVTLLVMIILFSEPLNALIQKKLYFDDIVFTRRSKFQEIVLTRNGNDFRLYLDGSLQFSTYDEYRYHEMLVFPALYLSRAPDKKVLVLGGGDGLAVRDLLKSRSVQSVTLIELDKTIINLAKYNQTFRDINQDALHNSRVKIILGDAYVFMRKNRELFDVIIADFPDPHDETISKLYTKEFYRMVQRSLKRDGIFVTQSTSPLFAREAFWCIHRTLREVFPRVIPYHVYIPTFGDWGFNLAGTADTVGTAEPVFPPDTHHRFISKETFKAARHFSRDCEIIEIAPNTFNKPVLYAYYLKGWKQMDL